MKPNLRNIPSERVASALLSRAHNVVDQIIEKLDEAGILGDNWEHLDHDRDDMEALRQAWIDLVFDELRDVCTSYNPY